MAEKQKRERPQTQQKLHGAPGGLQGFTEEPVPQRRPIAVSTHLEADPDDARITLRVTTLVFDDGTVWREDAEGWAQIYALGDEEPKRDG